MYEVVRTTYLPHIKLGLDFMVVKGQTEYGHFENEGDAEIFRDALNALPKTDKEGWDG